MKTTFKNLVELMEFFEDENTCKELLEQQRWGGKVVCPHCEYSEKIYTTNRGYKCASCLKKFTVTVGTVFENSKIKLRYWFAAIYLCSSHKKGISSHQLGRDLGVTQKTAWYMLHRVRAMLQDKNPALLSGEVQMDETYVGGKRANKHVKIRQELNKNGDGYVNMSPVFAMLPKEGNMKIIATGGNKVDGTILKPIIKANVRIGATAITDGFGGYFGLNKDYKHIVINHGKLEYAKDGFHTNSVEGFFSHFKRTIYGTYHSISTKHLNTYCQESAFRYNTRKFTEQERFNQALSQCTGALPYKELIAKVD